jgi:hypothetical protein
MEEAEQLRSLAVGYAGAVDRRDGPALQRLFADDAVLTVTDRTATAEPRRRTGDEIGGIAQAISHYPATFHLLGQSDYDVDGDRATGVTYCEAHHHVGELGLEAVDHVMYILYRDRYRRERDGWVIADRVVEVQWTTDLPVPGRAPSGRRP